MWSGEDHACRALDCRRITGEALARLQQVFGSRYTARNTLITTTHTQSGPGGCCGHLLYNLTTSGFRPTTVEAVGAGIAGWYRAVHHGTARRGDGTLLPSTGATRDFAVGSAAVQSEPRP